MVGASGPKAVELSISVGESDGSLPGPPGTRVGESDGSLKDGSLKVEAGTISVGESDGESGPDGIPEEELSPFAGVRTDPPSPESEGAPSGRPR
jgi:hypothetical protein